MRTLFLFVALTAATMASATTPQFMRLGQQALDRTLADVQACGLKIVSPYDLLLPRPQVPADEAIVTRANQLLAYTTWEVLNNANWFTIKNPNGSYPHRIAFGEKAVEFTTPQTGRVAFADRYYTVSGPVVRFFCRGFQVRDEQEFNYCVEQNFVKVLSQQLCRFQ
jgi:hypothetical protein